MRTRLLRHFSNGWASKAKPKARARTAGKDAMLVEVSDDVPATYWLYIRIRKTATLRDVDDLIRNTWAECCGHLSAFRAGGVSYMSSGDAGGELGTKTMGENATAVLGKGGAVGYEYDFGTTTGLVVTAAGACSAAGMKRKAEAVALCHNCEPKAPPPASAVGARVSSVFDLGSD